MSIEREGWYYAHVPADRDAAEYADVLGNSARRRTDSLRLSWHGGAAEHVHLLTGGEIEVLERGALPVIVRDTGPFDWRRLPGWVFKGNRFSSPWDIVAHDPFNEFEPPQYYNFGEINYLLYHLQNLFPDHATLLPLPYLTAEKRPTFALAIASHREMAAESDGDAALLISGVHAREWGCPDILLSFTLRLLACLHGGGPLQFGNLSVPHDVVALRLRGRPIVVAPCLNADGLNFTQTYVPKARNDALAGIWRKNRNTENYDDTQFFGTDINRNHAYLWEKGDQNVGSDFYRGRRAGSEPETRNVAWLIDRLGANSAFIDLHSFGSVALHSWGNAPNRSEASAPHYPSVKATACEDPGFVQFIASDSRIALKATAQRMSRAASGASGGLRHYAAQQLHQASGADRCPCGTSTDYAFSRHLSTPEQPEIHAWTFEIGTKAFQVDFREFLPFKTEACAALAAALFPGF